MQITNFCPMIEYMWNNGIYMGDLGLENHSKGEEFYSVSRDGISQLLIRGGITPPPFARKVL